MSEIESPETFWAHLCSHVTRYDAKHGLDFVLPLIRSRDRAIRAEARREAFAEAEHVCAANRCAGNNDIWPLAVLSCASAIRALAAKEPDDAK